MRDEIYDVIIVGGGPAGASAALYTARAELKTLVLDKSIMSGALGITSKIANYPGVKEVLSGAGLVKLMREHSASFGAIFLNKEVFGIRLEDGLKKVITADNEYTAKALIIATGAMGRKSRVPGEEVLIGKGVSYCATCDGAFFKDEDVAVVGQNEQALEESLFLTRFVNSIYLVVPSSKFIAEDNLINEVKENPKIKILMGRSLRKILGDDSLTGIVVSGTAQDEELKVKGVFIYLAGNQPDTGFLYDTVDKNPDGYIIVNSEMSTSAAGIFACGDVVYKEIKQAVVAASEGVIAALSAEKFIRKRAKAIRDYK